MDFLAEETVLRRSSFQIIRIWGGPFGSTEFSPLWEVARAKKGVLPAESVDTLVWAKKGIFGERYPAHPYRMKVESVVMHRSATEPFVEVGPGFEVEVEQTLPSNPIEDRQLLVQYPDGSFTMRRVLVVEVLSLTGSRQVA